MKILELTELTTRPFTIYRAIGRDCRSRLKYPHWVFRISFPTKGRVYIEEKTIRARSLETLLKKVKKYLMKRCYKQ